MHIVTSTDILLPRAEDMGAWSVIACDQFTSEPEYWAAAEARAAEKPSTLSLMLPEAWLHTARADGADGRIADTMRRYLAEGVFQTVPDSFIYVERTLSDGRVRRGLVAALDLEQYDFTGTQRTSVRSTEGTVEERLPPRVNIRRSAPLEMPHTLLLMDDRTDSVLSLAEKAKDTLEKVYDFDLMLGGGHIAGWRVSGETKAAVQSALDALDNAALQREKYGDAAENGKFTFAVGDGNHSLAAAKRFWEEKRETLPENERETDPARFALVEIENIHEPSLDFEPIHRVIFEYRYVGFRCGIYSASDGMGSKGENTRRARCGGGELLPRLYRRARRAISTTSTATIRRALSARSRTAPRCCCRRSKRAVFSFPYSKTALCRKRAFPWATHGTSAIISNAGRSVKTASYNIETPRRFDNERSQKPEKTVGVLLLHYAHCAASFSTSSSRRF